MRHIKIPHRKKRVTIRPFKFPRYHYWQEKFSFMRRDASVDGGCSPPPDSSWSSSHTRPSSSSRPTEPCSGSHPNLQQEKPNRTDHSSFLDVGLRVFWEGCRGCGGRIQDILRTGMFSSLKLYSQILQRSIEALGFLVVEHLEEHEYNNWIKFDPVWGFWTPSAAKFSTFLCFIAILSITSMMRSCWPCRCSSGQSNCWAHRVYGAACVCTRTANKLRDPNLFMREQNNY